MDLYVVLHDELELDTGIAVALFADHDRALEEAEGVVEMWATPDPDEAERKDLAEQSEISTDLEQAGVVWRRVYNVDGGHVSILKCPVH